MVISTDPVRPVGGPAAENNHYATGVIMVRSIRLFVLAFLALALVVSPALADDRTPDQIVVEATQALEQMAASSSNKGFPVDLLDEAAGVVIIPSMYKIGVVIGGSYGKGVIVARNGKVWSGPAFLEISAGSIGLQIGVQKSDVLLIVKTKRGLDSLLASQAKLGGGMGVTAGPVGADVSAATDTQLKAEIYSYARSKGLFAGISLEGAQVNPLPSFNEKYTGLGSSKAILSGKGKIPANGIKLQKLLIKLTAM